MLTKTALKSPRFLAAIKAAAVAAVRKSHAHPLPVGIGYALNRKGAVAVRAVAHCGRSVEYFDSRDRDVTAQVLAALRAWHIESAPLPLIQIDLDTGPMEGLPLKIKPALSIIRGGKAA
jgi:hypothetical protein